MQIIQNNVVIYMLCIPSGSHIGYEQCKHVGKSLPVNYRVKQLMLGHMYKIMNDSALEYLIPNVTTVQFQHSHNTRFS